MSLSNWGITKMTLKQLCDKIGIHPYDAVPDQEEADYYMNEDITDTIFYQEMKQYAKEEGIEI